MNYFYDMYRIYFILLVACFLGNGFLSKNFAQEQDHSHDATKDTIISMLTCAPGQELYSTFGHCAIRVIDHVNQSDAIFNYGMFNFDAPHFYAKFVRGKLDYELAVQTFDEFMYEYQTEQRSVQEQVLNLSPEQKRDIIEALRHNLEGNNRYYKYDFLMDNCSTRPRDLLYNTLHHVRITKNIIPTGTTSRDLLYYYLDKGGQAWSKLGIDILLGSLLDKPIDNRAAMFLPQFLMKAVDNSVNGNQPLVLKKQSLINVPTPIVATGQHTPLTVISVICLLIAAIQFGAKGKKNTVHLVDALLLYISGLLGILLVFMWLGTDHTVCKYNYNLLWAIPFNFIIAFFIGKKRKWLHIYFYAAFILTAILLGGWFWLPQHFNIAIAPFALLMLYRYGRLALDNK